MGHRGHALKTRRYMARSESGCLRRPLQSYGGRGYPLHHSSSPGVKLGVGRARVCTVYHRAVAPGVSTQSGHIRIPMCVPTHNQTVSQATKTSKPTCTMQPYSIEHHYDTGHGVKGGISTVSQDTVGGAGAQRAHLESRCGPTTPHQATPLHMQTHQSPTQANTRTASARRAQPGRAELRRGAAQGALARSGHTLKAAAGQPRHTRPHHCACRRIRAPHEPTRAQKALGARNQGGQSCGEVPCRGGWRAADTP